MTNQAKVILSGEDKLSAVFASVGRSADKLGFNLDGLKGGAVAALGALAVPVSAGALVALANEARQAIDEFNDLKDVTGSSIENISALDKLARETGTSFETVSTSLVKFNGLLKDADPEKGAGAVLKALNLDIEKLKRLDPAEALRQTAVALDGFEDGPEKGRAYLELFGKSARDIAPFIKDLAKENKLVGTVSDESAEQVERFNKELFKLQAEATDAARALSIDVVSALNQVVDAARGRDGAGGALSEWLTVPLQTAVVVGSNVAFVMRGIGNELGGIAAQAAAIATLDFSAAAAIGKMMREDAAAARKQQDDFERRVMGIGRAAPTNNDQSTAELARLSRQGSAPTLRVPSAGSGKRASGASAPKDPYAEANRYLDGLRKQLQATEELTVYEKLLADIRSGSLGKLTPQLQAQLEETAKLIDADKELADVTKQFAELEAENAKQRKALQDEGKSFYDATRTPIERLNIELGRQAELLKKLGPAYKDTAMRASEAAQDRYDAETKTTAAISELDQFTQRAAQNIQDYLGNSFQQLMEGNFSNIGDAFTQMLNNMVAQAAAAGLARELLGDLAQGGTSSGLFGGFLKDVVGSFGGFRAAGGPVQSGKGYVVGENGPEWFEPATSGMVVPNHALQGGGTTNSYSISVSMPSGASRSTGQQFGREIARQLSIANARNG